ncbi:MAG: class I SAM-dependent methyltransferase [Pyrinomonadaceae bacterium]
MLTFMEGIATQVNYWNRVADEKRFSHPLRLDWLKTYLNGARRILDYGCGYGRTLKELSDGGYHGLVGIDFSPDMLARSHLEVPTAHLIRNDGCTLPIIDGSCDAVLLFAVLTCVPDSDEQRMLMAEVERVLRPTGLLYISDLLINDDDRNRERYEQHANAYGCYGVFKLPEGVVVRHHEREWIAEITRPFEQLEYECFDVITMNGNVSAAFQYLGRKPEG